MSALARKGDLWAGLVLAGLGFYVVAQAAGWDYMTEEGPGPGFFPLWYGSAMVVLSLLLLVGTVLRRGGDRAAMRAQPDAQPQARKAVRWADLRRALTCWLALAACVAALKFIGFIAAFGLLTWFVIAVMFSRPHKEALAYAIGGSIGFHALFSWALQLPLPTGNLFS